MLSDHEMRTLRELERRLLDDDPDFPRRFDMRARRLDRRRRELRVATALVLALAAVLLVAGAPGAAFALVAVCGVVWLAWRWPRSGAAR